jgi:uncharacterized protein with FMN-binding domain
MAKKMPRGLVALSSSAVAAIYLAGFVYTQSADAGLASVAASVPTTAMASSTTVPTSTPVASSPTSTAVSTTNAYRDGTYTGSGTSRRGNVNVSLTIQSGRIANVTISSVTTQYPASRIAGLSAQVVARQSSQVDNVSGATYSAQAFSLAVQAALSKAGA